MLEQFRGNYVCVLVVMLFSTPMLPYNVGQKSGNIANIWEVQVRHSLSSNFYRGYLLQSLPGDRFQYCFGKRVHEPHKAYGTESGKAHLLRFWRRLEKSVKL